MERMWMMFTEKHKGRGRHMSSNLPHSIVGMDVMQPACVPEGWPGRVFSPVALCQTRCQLLGGRFLWAKQFAASLENSLHLQVEAVNLARQSRGSSEALVFAKDLVISCPLATSAPFFLPDLWCCWMLSHCCPYLLIPAGHSHQEWVLGWLTKKTRWPGPWDGSDWEQAWKLRRH